MFTSRTEKGNVATSPTSQEDADLWAKAMDDAGCVDCVDCANCVRCALCADCKYCVDCTDCTDCAYCIHCVNCVDCKYCKYCMNCDDCTNCTNCTNCRGCGYSVHCVNCTDCMGCTNCVNCAGCEDCTNWRGGEVRNLLCINAVPWPIGVSSTHMQIGCVNESHQWWLGASDEDIADSADVGVDCVAEYRRKYGALIAAALEAHP